MKRTSLTNHISAFKGEMLMILRFQLAYDRIFKFNDLHKISRSDFVDRLIALKTIENDLLVRICKFDDDTKGVHSFNKAILELNSTHQNQKEIIEKIKVFHKSITPLKRNRRHTKIAHLKIGEEDGDYEVKYDFVPIIKLMIKIIDLMNNKEVGYKWKDGRYEKFDLRTEILKETAE
ncbi:hypothetical protein [Lacinutrix cladophorae]